MSMRLGRRLKNKPWVQKAVGTLAAEYLRFVWMTSRFTMEPAEPFLLYEAQQPVIIAMWHGQHFLLPFLRRQYRFKVLISRHSDGEINAVAAERLGVGTVRGSGDHGTRFNVKGGVAGFKGMLESLEQGWNMAKSAWFANPCGSASVFCGNDLIWFTPFISCCCSIRMAGATR